MKIVLSGSTSIIGAKLQEYLSSSGHVVIPLGGSQSDIWRLGQTLPNHITGDVLIHLAHDRKLPLSENIAANKLLAESFDGYIIYLSTYSSHSNAKSNYGKSKFFSELIFTEKNGIVLRAGVIYGPKMGGIYRTLQTLLDRFMVIPLPFSGLSLIFTTHIDDLCSEVSKILEKRPSGIYSAANPWPITFERFAKKLNSPENQNLKIFVPIPSWISRIVFNFSKFLNLKYPLVDSLGSLGAEISLSELSQIRPSITSFRNFE